MESKLETDYFNYDKGNGCVYSKDLVIMEFKSVSRMMNLLSDEDNVLAAIYLIDKGYRVYLLSEPYSHERVLKYASETKKENVNTLKNVTEHGYVVRLTPQKFVKYIGRGVANIKCRIALQLIEKYIDQKAISRKLDSRPVLKAKIP